jgi:hypothetical protein
MALGVVQKQTVLVSDLAKALCSMRVLGRLCVCVCLCVCMRVANNALGSNYLHIYIKLDARCAHALKGPS